MKKYAFRLWRYSVLDCRAATDALNEMAARGYRLKSLSGCKQMPDVACFEADEKACRLQYAVDARLEDRPRILEGYYTFYRDLGWRLISVYRERLHIFVSEKGAAAPLYTDEQTEWSAMEENARLDGVVGKNLACGLAPFPCFLILQALLVDSFDLFLSIIFQVFFVILAACAVYFLTLAWSNYCFLRACKRCMAQGLSLPLKKSPCQLWVLFSLLFMPLFSLWIPGVGLYSHYFHPELLLPYPDFISMPLGWWLYGALLILALLPFYGGLYGTLVHPGSRAARILVFAGELLWFLIFYVGLQLLR